MKQKFYLLTFLVLLFGGVFGQSGYWTPVTSYSLQNLNAERKIFPSTYLTYSLDTSEMKTVLFSAPMEFTKAAETAPSIISLPLPGGGFGRFAIAESPVQMEGTPAEFAEIKTFSGKGIDDPTATVRLDWTAFGFHAMVLSAKETFYIDPFAHGNNFYYQVYSRNSLTRPPFEEEGVIENISGEGETAGKTTAICSGAILRTYRMAIACTGEYAQAVGGNTPAKLHSAIVTVLNRVNGIFENEFSIRLVLIPNNNVIEFMDPNSDPFTGNNTSSVLINESQTVISNAIGVNNFDIGHTFSTGAGGLAALNSVCNTSNKARGVTGLPNPVGDPFAVDFVSHEVGHQFGARHTFNGLTGTCGANRSSTTAVEPGSGVTIMSYSGNCTTENIELNSIPHFHARSYDEIMTFVNGSGGCGVNTSISNSVPVVSAGSNYTIPKGTPFKLTGTATDADGDLLTYSWEENDVAAAGGSWNSGNIPFFRSFEPTTENFRYFPRLKELVTTGTPVKGEFLPNSPQTLNFRLTARDNKPGGGASCNDQMIVTVASSGPFQISSQWAPETWTSNGTNTTSISWDVAGSNTAPVNCSHVDILFSADGGKTFPYVLKANTPNDGSESVIIPPVKTINGRVMVKAANNIFFTVNNQPITINTACAAEGAEILPDAMVTDYQGSAGLNLNLSPVYGGFNPTGTITSSSAVTNLTVKNSSNNCSQFGNMFNYEVYEIKATVSGTYTLSINNSSAVMNFYAPSYNPSSNCSNFLSSNAVVDAGNNLTVSPNLTVFMASGSVYNLVVGFFGPSSTVPASLPASYTINVTGAPSGGQVFQGNGAYPNPGAGFSYSYVIVNNANNNIVAISNTADLSNGGVYASGYYSVYGISYQSSAASAINAYVGQNFNNLTAALQGGSICANLSKNAVTVGVQAPLPVSFMPLTAVKENDNSRLSWSTQMELNTSNFVIEHSNNGKEFSEVGVVKAAGNSNKIIKYHFVHNKPGTGLHYYRIKSVDFDGKTGYSNIARLSFDKESTINTLVIYPNPAKERITIEFNTEVSGKSLIEVYDAKGSVLMQHNITSQTGRNTAGINVSALPTGIYNIKITDASGMVTHKKFIKE